MKDFLRRCLAIVLVLSMVLSTGVASAFAASTGSTKSSLDTSSALIAEPSEDLELIQDTLKDAANQLSGYDPNKTVVFIVELEGDTLLDSKPDSMTMSQYLASSAGVSAAKSIQTQQRNIRNQITKARSRGISVDYTYQVVLNGFAVSAPYSYKSYLESIPGVASVTVAKTYEYVEPVDGYTEVKLTSGVMIDSDVANANGYTGKGTVTAILDTGIDLDHEAFQNAPEDASLELSDIETLVAAGTLNASATAAELYKSAKVPFAFNYTDGTTNVNDGVGHGTHVAGTIGGDCEEFSGVAPDTQIVFMRVFNDAGSGATDAVIFAALEDCVILGVDSINMSLGTPSGFTSEDELTDTVYNTVMEAGINLMVSAGNETDSTNYASATDLPLVSEPDNGIVGSPSTYSAALSVASVNEYSEYITYILAGETKLVYTDSNVDTSLDFVNTFDGQTLEYVYVSGFGSTDDFAAVDVDGKIALVARGELAFTEKEANAADAGALGIIVFDNAEGDLIYMQSNGSIPAIFISKADGLALRDAENKTLSVSVDYKMFESTSDGGLMSSFSSLGVAPDLTLKPEITAPGGYVYSTLPGGTYGSMSGTSMAAPHMTGAASVVRQYVNEAFPDLSDTEKQELINTLLMNTAIPVEDEYGVAYTPRKQGAGLAQVNAAINTGAYVTVDGNDRPKAELGDSANGYFSKEVTLTIHNISDADLTYNMSAIPLTAQEETVTVNGVKYNCISNYARILPDSEFQVTFSANSVTVPAGGTATVSVKLRLTTEGEAALANFTNGTFLDGFIVLESQDISGIDLSVPYLGFYGDWGQASVYDASIYGEEEASVYASSMAAFDLNTGSGYYLGMNMFSDDLLVDENKIAMSYDLLGSYVPFTLLGLLRAPKSLTYTITDAEGNPVELFDAALTSYGYEYTTENVIKSFYYSTGGFINYEMGPMYYGWLPAQYLDNSYYSYLPDGQYDIHVTAQVDGTDSPAGTQTISFPFTLDSQDPQLLSTDFEEVDGTPYVTVNLYDNHYLMAFQLISSDGMYAFSPAIPVDEEEPGATSSFTFDTSALLEDGFTTAILVAYDYAQNFYMSYEFSLEADTLQPASVYINNKIMSISGSQTFEVEAYVEPEGLEDTVLTWTSSDESIATVKALDKTRYDADAGITLYTAEVTTYNVGGDVTISVSTQNGKTDSFTMRVVADYTDLPDDYVIREDGTYLLPENLNTKVRITDEAQNVVVIGNSANTAENPYQGLYLCSEVENLNLTIRDLNVTTTGGYSANPVIEFTGSGNTLTITGENTFIGTSYGSAALVEANGAHYTNNYTAAELTINGSGTLNATQPGNTYGAAIGGEAGAPGGVITIDGATINAVTEGYGAAIGGGNGGNSGDITINGGNITANSHYAMAGWSYNQNYAGAAIGAGNGAYGGTNSITINGGEVTATTSTNSAAIGGALCSSWSQGSDTTNVTINSGKVVASTINEGGTATGGGAAIGSSYYGGTANITINGGEVIAITGNAAAGIGSGYWAKAATVTVNGGTVSALANSTYTSDAYHGAAIGKGAYATAGYIYVNKGAVAANTIGTVYNSDMTALVEVTLTLPGVKSLMIDGVDWKVSCNHADFTESGGKDYSDEVHVWLAKTTDTPYIVTAETEEGTMQFELYTNGSTYEFHSVTYDLTGLATDGPAKVYDPSAGEDYNADLTGTLALVSRTTMVLPQTISVTVDGEEVAHTYDPETGTFSVSKELLTGDVVLTAAAEEVVDKTALNELIAQVETMDETAYTGDSWSALEEALAAAKAAAAEDPTTQAAVDAAYEALKAAVEALVIRADASELEALIAEADKLVEADYVSDTWPALAEALEDAKAVVANSNATEEEIQEAIDALKAAMEALVKRGDKTELRKLIDEADSLFEVNYTPESWTDSGLEDALADAIAVYTDPDATQEAVDAAAAALQAALDKLYARADKTELLALIAKAEELNVEDYTADSWAALEAALAAAKALAEDPNALQTEVDAAAAALQQAIANLIARGDTTKLEEAIEEAEGLNEEDYTPETWGPVEEALEAAKETAEDPNATQEDVDAALEALEEAMDALVQRADTSALEEAIEKAEALNEENYTPETWADVEKALEDAKAVLADPNASQEEVDLAAAALEMAMQNLTERADTAELEALIAEAEALNEDEFTPVTWAPFEEILEDAKAVLADLNATQEEVDAAAEALAAALQALTEGGDKSALQAAYDASQALVETAYTAESWAAVPAAQEAAKAVLDDPNATQEDVDAAYEALMNALNTLERAGDASALKCLIKQAEEALEDYTDESAKAIQEAIDAAKEVVAARPDQDALDEAYDELAKALADGVKKPADDGNTSNPGGDDNNGDDTTEPTTPGDDGSNGDDTTEPTNPGDDGSNGDDTTEPTTPGDDGSNGDDTTEPTTPGDDGSNGDDATEPSDDSSTGSDATEPSTGSGSGSSSNTGSNASTGDETPVIALMVLLCLSAAGLAILIPMGKKRRF